ncbi:spore germination protein [Paenibacillus phoenicis]|uniref:Spore germination protein n=1 Tax=Paenibacillus phoenicis TaxID=554117 RepID=A0ABU5PIT1_9BACL|nr:MULTISPECIES: spore germination protein [Paenibacillus]MCT2195425.1 spore germination protein [Paenibacillus sp. p3-SID1389]MEA3569772.1 spore germination protein [Paenibacillus phoenicis]
MLNNITTNQIFALFSLQSFTTVIAFYTAMLLGGSKYSTPMAVLVGALLGLLFCYPAYKLASSRPNEFFVQFGSKVVGRPLHFIFVLYIVLLHLFLAALNLRELADFLLSEYLIGTPDWAVVAIFGVCVAYAVRCGILTIFRMAEGFFLVFAAALICLPFIGFQEMELDMFTALINHLSVKDMWASIVDTMAIFGEMAFLFLLFPYLETPKKVFRTLFWATLTSLLLILMHLIPILLTFGPKLGANLVYPDMELVRFIRVGSFIETMDPILISLWLTSIFVKMSFIVYTAVLCLAQLAGVKDHKPFTLPVVAFVSIYSLSIVRTPPEIISFLSWEGALLFCFAEFIIPSIYWFIGAIRKKSSGSKTTKPAGSTPTG